MKKIAAALLGVVLIASPLAISALTPEEAQLQIRNLLTAIAVLKAEKAGTSAACALITSSQSVVAGEPFLLLWSSYGADDPSLNRWPPSGGFTVALKELGVWKYTFDFYGKDGYKATCTTIISVHR